MISYYKGEFLNQKDIPINTNLFRGLGVFETIKFINQNDFIMQNLCKTLIDLALRKCFI